MHRGFNAEADESTVLFVHRKRTAKNPAMELMITAMLHKTDDAAWTPEELSPVKNIRIMDVTPSGSVLGAEITLGGRQRLRGRFQGCGRIEELLTVSCGNFEFAATVQPRRCCPRRTVRYTALPIS